MARTPFSLSDSAARKSLGLMRILRDVVGVPPDVQHAYLCDDAQARLPGQPPPPAAAILSGPFMLGTMWAAQAALSFARFSSFSTRTRETSGPSLPLSGGAHLIAGPANAGKVYTCISVAISTLLEANRCLTVPNRSTSTRRVARQLLTRLPHCLAGTIGTFD